MSLNKHLPGARITVPVRILKAIRLHDTKAKYYVCKGLDGEFYSFTRVPNDTVKLGMFFQVTGTVSYLTKRKGKWEYGLTNIQIK